MASIIRIKRSSTHGDPGTLGAGELAYSAADSATIAGGDRLYIGFGTETDGNAATHYVIGGAYFTSMLDHAKGTLTLNSAIITDANNKIDQLKTTNLQVGGASGAGLDNTILSTNTDGNIILNPSGTGLIALDSATVRVGDNNANATITTQGTGDLTLNTNSGTNSGSIVILDGAGQNISITPEGTGKISLDGQLWPNAIGGADTYLKTDAGGVLSWAAIPSGTFTITGDSGTDTFATGGTLTFTGTNPVQTAITDDTVTISVDDATTTTKGIASFATADFTVTSGAVAISNVNLGTQTSGNYAADVTVTASTGLSITGAAGEGTSYVLAGVDATTAVKGVASFSSDNFAVTSGAVTIKDGGVSNAELVNSSITINSTAVSLGGSITGLAVTSGTLAQFAATTSLQLAGVIDDETGSGALVFATSPTLVTPVLGVATATSITGSSTTLTLAAGVGVTGNNNVILAPAGDGTVDVSSKRITGVATPTGASDAATKGYVDAVKTGLDVKDSVRLASTVQLVATYSNGTAGVGATLTNAGTQAALQLDSVTVVGTNRVLVKNQTDNPEWNGIYVVTTVGTGATNWVLTRAEDFDQSAEVTGGAFTFVEAGATQADNGYVVSTDSAITVGTTGIDWVQFSGAGQITAGAGLTKTGNILDVGAGEGITVNANDVALASTVAGDGLTYTTGVLAVGGTADRISVSANAIDIASTYAGQASIVTVGALSSGSLTTGFTTVAVAQGGTGATSFTTGGLLYGNDTSALSAISAGTAGYFLVSGGTGVAPSWVNSIDGGTYSG